MRIWTPPTVLRALAGAVVVPGLRVWRDGGRILGVILGAVHLGAIGVLCWLLSGGIDRVLYTALSPDLLGRLLVTMMLWSAALAISVIHVWRDERYFVRTRIQGALLHLGGAALMGASLVPMAAGAWVVLPQIGMLEDSLVQAPVARPTIEAAGEPVPSTTVFDGGFALRTEDGRFNVLLMGSDGGSGRWGRRVDSANVVSLDPRTGEVAMIGIPRNLVGAPMPGTLKKRFPAGYPGLFNALYTWAQGHQDQVRDAVGETEEPGASLIAASAAELTGLRIDGWVMVDMEGFLELVDALGGVQVFVPKAVPPAGDIPQGKHGVPPLYKVGWHDMDGTDALAYVRSRKGDSDYQRMARQRCVLLSLAAQSDPVEIAARWPALTAVAGRHLRTNLRAEQIEALSKVRTDRVHDAALVALVPPVVRSSRWSLEEVRALVRQAVWGAGTSGENTGTGETGASNPESGPVDQQIGSRAGNECRLVREPGESGGGSTP